MAETNWAEDEILRLSNIYGKGKYKFFVHSDGKAQRKQYGKYTVSYPDIENYLESIGLVLLVEVKSRRTFYKNNGYLGLKKRQKGSYETVQDRERVPVRLVYLIGTKDSYELYWAKLWEIDSIIEFGHDWKDVGDKKSEPYLFFHSSNLSTDIQSLFRL